MKKNNFEKAFVKFLSGFCTDIAAAQFLTIPLDIDPQTLTVRIILCILYSGFAISLNMITVRYERDK